MPQQPVQYEGAPTPDTKMVYFSDTDTLAEGYCLCYDAAATHHAADQKLAFGTKCIKPATGSLKLFAGIVDATYAGKVGPCWVKINTPTVHSFSDAWTHSDMTLQVTLLMLADDDFGLITDAAYATGETVAMALETVDTGTTAALARVKWVS